MERGPGGTRKLAQGGQAQAPAALPDRLEGRTVAGRYEVLETIGRGGMGTVYRARHVLIHKDVALKVLHPRATMVEGVADRFRREARAAARIDDPHVVRVTDFGVTDEGLAFLVLEHLTGRSLRAEIARGPLAAERAAGIACQTLEALEAAHGQGIAHRDLKPENIFLVDGPGLEVKLLDFGLAKIFDGDWTDEGRLTVSGLLVGTPHYMAPEQARSPDAVGPLSDIYSLGVVLYEMLTGARPFDAPSALTVLGMHERDAPTPPSTRRPDLDIPEQVEAVALRAMAKDPEGRFASARAMREALLGRVAPRDPAPRGRGWRWLAIPVLAAGVLALLMVLGPARQAPRRPSSASPTRPTATPAPPDAGAPGSATLRDAGESFVLEVHVVPASGRIVIDGRPSGVGHARIHVPRDKVVILAVRAPGFRAHRQRLVIDGDRSLTVRLRPVGSPREPSIDLEGNPYRRGGGAPHQR